MNRLRCVLVLILVIGAESAGLGAPRLAGQPARTHGRVEGTLTATPISISETLFRVDVIATGVLSRIGHIEANWAVPRVTLDMVNRQLIVANPHWHGRITAANGDQIFGDYAFRENTIPFSTTGDLLFDVTLTITGGTGRFRNATGQAVAVGTANVLSGAFTIEVEGGFAR